MVTPPSAAISTSRLICLDLFALFEKTNNNTRDARIPLTASWCRASSPTPAMRPPGAFWNFYVPSDRHHRLSRRRRDAGKRATDGGAWSGSRFEPPVSRFSPFNPGPRCRAVLKSHRNCRPAALSSFAKMIASGDMVDRKMGRDRFIETPTTGPAMSAPGGSTFVRMVAQKESLAIVIRHPIQT